MNAKGGMNGRPSVVWEGDFSLALRRCSSRLCSIQAGSSTKAQRSRRFDLRSSWRVRLSSVISGTPQLLGEGGCRPVAKPRLRTRIPPQAKTYTSSLGGLSVMAAFVHHAPRTRSASWRTPPLQNKTDTSIAGGPCFVMAVVGADTYRRWLAAFNYRILRVLSRDHVVVPMSRVGHGKVASRGNATHVATLLQIPSSPPL